MRSGRYTEPGLGNVRTNVRATWIINNWGDERKTGDTTVTYEQEKTGSVSIIISWLTLLLTGCFQSVERIELKSKNRQN